MKKTSCLKDHEIIDLDYSYTYFKNHDLNSYQRNNFQIFIDLLYFSIKQIIKDLLCVFRNKNIRDKYILYYGSVNQLNALLPIKNKLDNSVLCGPYKSKNNYLPMAMGCIISFFYLPHFYKLSNEKDSNYKLLRSGNYYLIEGMYKWWLWYLKYKKPKAILFSNDHLIWHRVLRKAAQQNKIPTIYIQHASVTEKFPKLEFDLSLLEGQDALDKYSKKGIDGKVELIGMPKFDKYFSFINRTSKIQTIGVCTNILDENNYIEGLCAKLKDKLPELTIILRPHPRDSRVEFYKFLKEKYDLSFSDSKIENSFEFLKKIDFNIAAETSVHLEAVLMNVYTVYYNMSGEFRDHYGYIKNGLIHDVFKQPDELVVFVNSILNNKPNIRHRSKYYVDTVNTINDGKSSEKALRIIEKITSSN